MGWRSRGSASASQGRSAVSGPVGLRPSAAEAIDEDASAEAIDEDASHEQGNSDDRHRQEWLHQLREIQRHFITSSSMDSIRYNKAIVR
jgi:hypothetical protein